MAELNTLDPPPTQTSDEGLEARCVAEVPCIHGEGTSGEPSVTTHVNAVAESNSQIDESKPAINNANGNPDHSEEVAANDDDHDSNELLGKLPPEIGMLLVISGVAGILLPGLVGTPLLIAGGVSIWPKTFEPIERWFSRRFPSAHKEGVIQIKEFISDLHKRFPEKS